METSTLSSEERVALARVWASRMRGAGLVGPYASADSELGREAFRRALDGGGTYLWGEPGTGKTHAAACAVRMAIKAGLSARLVTAARLLASVRDGWDSGDRDVLSRAERCGLLALDDLGAERASEWAMETITRLIDTRLAEGRPTIVTSNYRLGQLRDAWGGVHGARIASRIAGMCAAVEVAGEDRRLRRGMTI